MLFQTSRMAIARPRSWGLLSQRAVVLSALVVLATAGLVWADQPAVPSLSDEVTVELPLSKDAAIERGDDALGEGFFAVDKPLVPPVAFDPEIRLAQQIQDPAIETVDEMTARPGAGGSSAGRGAAGNWWDSIRDPSIRTVDEQTYGAG